ncbi:AAA family ATPase [Arenimonas sp.]|jgi:predicted kinase|uniref:AAA family ATPase n=1 Tax=Arenimonas sp. TaxID=1872635 RepID=UPI0037BE4983
MKNLISELSTIQKEIKEIRNKLFAEIITEGVDDPGILKCVFLAGGPGSGKSYTAKEIFGVGKGDIETVSAGGLKLISSDMAFEQALKKNGINPKDLADIEKNDPNFWAYIAGEEGDSIRNKAKAVTQKQQAFYEAGRLGMIIDGTGDEILKIRNKKEKAEKLGYDCYMVFVNTSLEVAIKRNAERSRSLPESLVREVWSKCQENMGKFQGIFHNNFIIVDNTEYQPVSKSVQKQVDAFLRKPIENPIGKKWILGARLIKKHFK